MKKEKYNYLILIALCLFLMFVFVGFDKMLGSYTDWINQHTIFPEYFRKLFYDTGNIFPNFAFNYGGGQNIYNLSYYGLYNPFILLSYFFPFIKMADFITIINIIVVVSSTLLFYKWMRKHFSSKLTLLSSIIFLCATPLIFHTHRHIMFISYMPFLILALMGVDRYFEKKKCGLLIGSVFLMILTSYYYSVCGMLCVFSYGIVYYLRKHETVTWKEFFKAGFKFCLPLLMSILLASFLLLPTLYSIMGGRNGSIDRNVWGYLWPALHVKNLLYDAYSFGLIGLFFISLIYFCRKQSPNHLKFLAIFIFCLAFIPICVYWLNGGLYARPKVLITFIPLGVYLITEFIQLVLNKKVDLKRLVILVGIGALVITLFEIQEFTFYNILFIADLIVMLWAISLFYKYHKENIIYGFIIFVCGVMFLSSNCWEEYIKKEDYQKIFDENTQQLIENTLQNDKDIYRFHNLKNPSYTVNKIYSTRYYQTSLYSSTYNEDYHRFYYSTFKNPNPFYNNFLLANTENVLFDMFMGVKYVVSDKPLSLGYQDLGNGLYQTEGVFPIMYANSSLYSLIEFRKESYPKTLDILLHSVIVQRNGPVDYQSSMEAYALTPEQLGFVKDGDSYVLETTDGYHRSVELPQSLKGKLLLLSFEVTEVSSCDDGDLEITINGIKNKLTCKEWIYPNQNKVFHYVISEDELENLSLDFAKGRYSIQNFEAYTLDYDSIVNQVNNLDPFVFDLEATKGDVIAGNIHVKKDGYFVTSIPYDRGFTVTVDGKQVRYEKVNTAFIGFPISEGEHEVRIVYEAPYARTGRMISFVTLIGLGIIWIIRRIMYKKSIS